jgi:hypothetical protein
MTDEEKLIRLIAFYKLVWDKFEALWVSKNAHVFAYFGIKDSEALDWNQIGAFIQDMRAAGYDEWLGVFTRTPYFMIYRNKHRALATRTQCINFSINSELGFDVIGNLYKKEYRFSLNPISLTSELKALLDLLKAQPLD